MRRKELGIGNEYGMFTFGILRWLLAVDQQGCSTARRDGEAIDEAVGLMLPAGTDHTLW